MERCSCSRTLSDDFHIQRCTAGGSITGQRQLIGMQTEFNINNNKLSDAALLGEKLAVLGYSAVYQDAIFSCTAVTTSSLLH